MNDVNKSDETNKLHEAADEKGVFSGGRCPQCKKSATRKWRPFCSPRCADVDLGKWLSGSYVIAGGSADSEEDGMPDMNRMDVPDQD